MRHRNRNIKLGRHRSHRKALLATLVRSLFAHERIKTTLAKAKAAQRLAERIINKGTSDDVSARRYAYSYLQNHQTVKRLFDEIIPRFTDRTGGFTRIFLLGSRPGDGAQMAVLEIARKAEPKKSRTSRFGAGKRGGASTGDKGPEKKSK